MKVQVIKKVKTEVDIDVKAIVKNLISNNIEFIVDNLMDEFTDDPETYINDDDIVLDEDIQISLNECVREHLDRVFKQYAEIR